MTYSIMALFHNGQILALHRKMTSLKDANDVLAWIRQNEAGKYVNVWRRDVPPAFGL